MASASSSSSSARGSAPAPGSGGAVMPVGGIPPAASTDPNIHFDQTSGKWQWEDPNTGEEWEYEEEMQKWRRVVDDDQVRQQQDAYSVRGVDEETPAQAEMRRLQKRKRKANDEGATDPNDVEGEPTSTTEPLNEDGSRVEGAQEQREAKAAKKQQGSKPPRQRVNSSVFLSRLPLDATVDEIHSVFSRYGIISEDNDGTPRVKLYHDTATGLFKGEALVTYFKPESCELAINLLDGTSLRAAMGQTKPEMNVQMAEWSPTANKDAGGAKAQDSTGAANREAGGQNGSAQPANAAATSSSDKAAESASRPPRTESDKRKAAKRFARLNDRLQGWESDSDEEQASALTAAGIRAGYVHPTSRLVILKHMFTLIELEEDPTLLLDLKSDVREECETMGNVTSVNLYDEEPEGVMTVKFKYPEDARECVKRMDGRYFAQRRVEASLAEGRKVRFRRSGRERDADLDDADDDDDDDDDDRGGHKGQGNKSGGDGGGGDNGSSRQTQRQDDFGDWLEAGGDDDGS
ncbi:unnamed protein product [Jaminaea pallidilutea]